MSKQISVVRTFPNAWYKYIVEGDTTGLADSERLIVESAMTKAFPDGGSIVAARRGTETTKFSTLVCESYSINGFQDKTEGKTFKVKVVLDDTKNPKSFAQYVNEDYKKENDPLQFKEEVVEKLKDVLGKDDDDAPEMTKEEATKVLEDCGYANLDPMKFWTKVNADIDKLEAGVSEKTHDKITSRLEAAYAFRNIKENHIGSAEDPEIIRDRINRKLEEFLTRMGDLKDGELVDKGLADLSNNEKAIAAHKNLGYLADMPIDKFWYGVWDLIRKYGDKDLPKEAKERIRSQLVSAYLIRDDKWNNPSEETGDNGEKGWEPQTGNGKLKDAPSDSMFFDLDERCGKKWTELFGSKLVKTTADSYEEINPEDVESEEDVVDDEGNVTGKRTVSQTIRKWVKKLAKSAEETGADDQEGVVEYGPLSDDEIDELEIKKDDNGVELVPVIVAAKQLREAIVEAYEKGDKESLEKYRDLLPILAYDITRNNGAFLWKLRQLGSRNDRSETIKNGYVVALATLPKVYNKAFDLDDVNPFAGEKTEGNESLVDKDITDMVGGNNGLLGSEKMETLKKDDKEEYAKKVLKSVIYGKTYDDFLVVSCSSQADRLSAGGREMARQIKNDKEFRQWFNKNIDEREDESAIRYGKVQYILESIADNAVRMASDVEKGLHEDSVQSKDKVTFKEVSDTIAPMYDKVTGSRAKDFDGDYVAFAAALFCRVAPGATATNRYGKWVVKGSFKGSVSEFKTAVAEECNKVEQKCYELEESLKKSYDEYKEKNTSMLDAFKKTGKFDKDSSKLTFSPFNGKDAVFADGSENANWLSSFVGSNVLDWSRERYEEYIKRVNSRADELALEKPTSAEEEDFIERGGDTSSVQFDGGSKGLDDTLGDLGSTSDGNDDEEPVKTSAGTDGVTTQVAKDTEGTTSDDMSVKRDEFLDTPTEELTKKAARVGIDEERVAEIKDWLKEIVSLPGGLGEKIGIYSTRGNKEHAEATKKIANEIKDKEKAFAEAKKAFKKAEKDFEREARKNPDADSSELDAARDAMEAAEDVLKATRDNAKAARDINKPDMTKAFDVSKFTAKEVNSLGTKENRGDKADGKITKTTTDANNNLSTEAKMALVREELAKGGVKIDKADENDKNRYSTSGIPDLLILWYLDDIAISDKMTADEKIAAIRKVCSEHLGSFEQFMARQCKLEDLFSTHEMGMDESAGQDKFLASLEAMIELVEGSDIDPEKKLEMLDAVEFAFTAWCEKEEIVPEDVNPQDDTDAITNHPEDDTESESK